MKLFMTLVAMLVGVCPLIAATADVVVVDAGVLTVSGSVPVAPAAGEVKIGGGTVAAGTVVITQSGSPTGNQAIRGDDPRLTNSRPANGGNANTVGGKSATDFVGVTEKGAPNGIATLDATGKVPAAQLPQGNTGGGGGHYVKGFIASGTFTVPAGVTSVVVEVWGAGGTGGGSFVGRSWISHCGGGGGYALSNISVTAGQAIPVIVGLGGAIGGTSSFGTQVIATGGKRERSAGIGTAGELKIAGQTGSGSFGGAAARGGSGGASTGTANGQPGAFPGGGGGVNAAGANGFVLISW